GSTRKLIKVLKKKQKKLFPSRKTKLKKLFTVNIIYFLLIIALVSLMFPAWIVSKQAYPSFKMKGFAKPFQSWFLMGFVWLVCAWGLHIFISMMSILNAQAQARELVQSIHLYVVFVLWLSHCAVGGVLWVTSPAKKSLRMWNYMCIIFNLCAVVYLVIPYLIIRSVVLAVPVATMWFLTVRLGMAWFKNKGDIASFMVTIGALMGGLGAFIWLIGQNISLFWGMFGIHVWVVAGGICIAAGLMHYILEQITGIHIYSKKIGLLTALILVLGGPWSLLTLKIHPSAMGTVLGVGLGFAGFFIGTNVWQAFAALKEKTIDELSARWVSLGAWLPAGITIQFTAFGAWCLFIGSILYVISSFQNVSIHLMPTLWREGIIKISVICGAGSLYIAAAYCAFSQELSTPDDRIAELGYWHYMGGSILTCLSLLLGGLVYAVQKAAGGSEAILTSWQRPFYAGAAVGGILTTASLLILVINLFRAGNVHE
ncbi:MAG: hypothetical protein ABII23_08220, partial [bacterium]